MWVVLFIVVRLVLTEHYTGKVLRPSRVVHVPAVTPIVHVYVHARSTL